MDWSEGYVTDVGYTYGYYKELNPLLQSFSLATSGRQAPDITAPFVKVELGCGYGLTALIEAAVYPQSQIYALDFNPNHITWAKRIAADAKLENVTFFDSSFADLLDLPIPPADYVGMHGVWSWISQDNRDAITRYMTARLKSGGLAMISYNAMPGWSVPQALREIMMRKYRSNPGPTDVRVTDALEFARGMAKIGGPFFAHHTNLQQSIEGLFSKPVRYMAHEYFNQDWHLFYHHQVRDSLSNAKLSFAGTCRPIENFERFCYPPQLIAMLDQVAASERESLKDIYNNRNFRYDLYGRGIEKGPLMATADQLSAIKLVLLNDKLQLADGDKTPIGPIKISNAIVGPVLDRLKQGAQSGAALAAANGQRELQPNALAEIMVALLEAGDVTLGLPDQHFAARQAATERLNDVLVDRFKRGEDIGFLASPVSGFGHNFNDIDKLFITALKCGKDPAEYAWSVLKPLDRRLTVNGANIEGDRENLQELNVRFQNFSATSLAKVKRLGLL